MNRNLPAKTLSAASQRRKQVRWPRRWEVPKPPSSLGLAEAWPRRLDRSLDDLIRSPAAHLVEPIDVQVLGARLHKSLVWLAPDVLDGPKNRTAEGRV